MIERNIGLDNNFFESGFFTAMCLFIALFMLPLISRDLRKNKPILFGYWFVLSLHQAIAFSKAYHFDPGRWGPYGDARGFHTLGEKLAVNEGFPFGLDTDFYLALLVPVYKLFGPAYLLGAELSILMFAFSCIVFLKIMQQFGIVRHRLPALIAFGALPNMVLLGSETVRESYQLFFFMLAVYFGVEMHKKSGMNAYVIAFIVSALTMGFFHQGLIIYSLALITLLVFFTHQPVIHFWNMKKLRLAGLLVIPIVLAGLFALSKTNLTGVGLIPKIFSSDALEITSNLRAVRIKQQKSPFVYCQNCGADHVVAGYGIPLDLSSFGMAISSTINLYAHYLFGPFPWKIRSVNEAYASSVGILRVILIYFSVREWRKAYGPQRRLLGLMLILYFSITFMWSLGTANYGTAARHHMTSWWIIVIIGVPPLVEKLSRIRLVFSERKYSS